MTQSREETQRRGRLLLRGMRDGIPIMLGYFAVSFTLGIAAKKTGLTAFQAVLMSITNLTSAGEFAALGLIASGGALAEMAVTQLIINIRYCLMSCALSQKLETNTTLLARLGMAYGITDEIFAVSASVPGKLHPCYTYGVILTAAPGWALGTFFGVISGGVLPERMLSAMGVALYGMFLAVIMPPVKKNRVLALIVAASMGASALFSILPGIREISSGFRLIVLTAVIAGGAAVLFPVNEKGESGE